MNAERNKTPVDYPRWYHHHGGEMRVEKLDKHSCLLIIAGGVVARLIIRRKRKRLPEDDSWSIKWRLEHERGEISGQVSMQTEMLKSAFDFDSSVNSAAQGRYVRYKKFLNIPCSGTGSDGDPNISIFLTEEIRDSVRQLLE